MQQFDGGEQDAAASADPLAMPPATGTCLSIDTLSDGNRRGPVVVTVVPVVTVVKMTDVVEMVTVAVQHQRGPPVARLPSQ